MSNPTGPAAYAAMKALGVTRVVASFAGGNDEGGYDSFSFYNGETELDRFEDFDSSDQLAWDEATRSYVPNPGSDPHRTAIGGWLEDVLNGSYGSFAGDFYVSGTVTLNAVERTTVMEGTEEEPVGHPIHRTF